MSSATMTSKGQITVPIEVRRKFKLSPGDKLDFMIDEMTGVVTITPRTMKADDVFGILQRQGLKKHLDIEDMDKKLAEDFARSNT